MKVKFLFGKDNEVDYYVKVLFAFAITVNDFNLGVVIYKEL